MREVLSPMEPEITMAAAAATLPPMLGDFVLLGSGALQLLLPQADVGAAGHLGQRPRPSGPPGLFEIDTGDGQAALVVALSSRMEPMDEFPESRFLLTSFSGHDGVLLCWDEAKVLGGISLQPLALPAAMMADDAPVDAYVEFGDRIAFRSSGDRLLAHVFAALN